MTAVSDSSPLIVLAKLGCFDLLKRLFPQLYISTEVHQEVVIAGAGLPGASEVAGAQWIEVRQLGDQAGPSAALKTLALGAGEFSTILLARELSADAVLLDDYNARKVARAQGLNVRGTVGLLETFYERGYLSDLRAVFLKLIERDVYVDRRLLDSRLRSLGLPPMI